MNCTSEEAENIKNNLEPDWVRNAQFRAKEFSILKDKARENKSLTSAQTSTSCFFSDNPEWNIRARKYLLMETQSEEIASNSTIAAKLAVTEANAEVKLTTAIELAKSGYIVCSSASLLDIVENEGLDRTDRLNACLLTIESIIATRFTSQKEVHTVKSYKEWNFALKIHKQCTALIRTALELHKSQERLHKLSCTIKALIDWTEKDGSPQSQKQQIVELKIASSRAKTQYKLAKIYQKPVIRTIHHLACTGGTLISKCISAMPETALISEINPMNRCGSTFEPTNPLLLLERNYRELTTEERITNFKLQISEAFELCRKDDVDLILRDHSHTDFCVGNKPSEICPIRDSLASDYELISVVSVRHPLDSYLGLINAGWEKQLNPNDLNEYSKRYLSFLEKYSSLKIIRYEDFCAAPAKVMKELCNIIEIEYDNEFIKTFGRYQLSGDSGRKDLEVIEKRPRRPIPIKVESEIETSACYRELIQRLGY
ncbi:hypothetical protein OAZ24_01260 [Synechococcus sp. AH-736-G21]|nr:hypothetical protein [Synechococcus sp. AH-736-G21]